MQIRVGDYVATRVEVPRFGNKPIPKGSTGFVSDLRGGAWRVVIPHVGAAEYLEDELIRLVKGEDNS